MVDISFCRSMIGEAGHECFGNHNFGYKLWEIVTIVGHLFLAAMQTTLVVILC